MSEPTRRDGISASLPAMQEIAQRLEKAGPAEYAPPRPKTTAWTELEAFSSRLGPVAFPLPAFPRMTGEEKDKEGEGRAPRQARRVG